MRSYEYCVTSCVTLKKRVPPPPFKALILLGSENFGAGVRPSVSASLRSAQSRGPPDLVRPITRLLKNPLRKSLRGFLRKKARPRTHGFGSRLRLGRSADTVRGEEVKKEYFSPLRFV